ncbi:MAG: methyltransferase domain-containing protein [Candidatus Marinimicrobia bacterium]|nr:methyltransferase domain-containing protein [Candidatus Neomarinimicrobiota bacterium]
MNNIKRMKLYRHPERIYNEINAAGYKNGALLKEGDIASFDQYHYLGTDAVDDAIGCLKIDSRSKLIDIGSGLGGPARYLAEKTGCHVTALELQPDLHRTACSLTERCGLSGSVHHLCGNILDFPEKGSNFDAVVSWLSFLHIPDRSALLKKCCKILKPSGKMFIEDFCKRGEFDREETRILSKDIQCPYLPTAEEYKDQLIKNSFTEVDLVDKTDCWNNFVRDREEKFIKNRNRYTEIHGIEITEEIEDFYKKMLQLFNNGNLGGLRIIAMKDQFQSKEGR